MRRSAAIAVLIVGMLLGGISPAYAETDADGDGSPASVDCNDNDARIFPGAADTPSDGIDSNCDGRDFPSFGGYEASIYRLYQAYFLREPDAGGWAYWGTTGLSVNDMSYLFEQSDEFKLTYGDLSSRDFVTLVYNNVLERTPDQGGYDYWLNLMNGGLSKGNVMINFSESLEFGRKTGTVTGAEEVPLLLTQQDTVSDNGCTRGYNAALPISGSIYEYSTYCYLGYSDEVDSVDWLLDKQFNYVTAQLGVHDKTAAPAFTARFNIYVDGVRKLTRDIGYGESAPVTVAVAGALRIRIEAVRLSSDYGSAAIGTPVAYVVSGTGRPAPAPAVSQPELLLTTQSTVDDAGCTQRFDDPITMGSSHFDHSTYCYLGYSDEVDSVDWLLSRQYRALDLTVGVLDTTEKIDATARVIIYLDGREAKRIDVAYGDTVPVQIDVTGALRIRVEAIRTSSSYVSVGIGHPVARP